MRRAFVFSRPETELACTETGSGPTVILLHAGGERRGVWKPVATRLANAGVRSIAVDQRGHGDSGGATDKLPVLADDVCALIDHVACPVMLVGASLGGHVSLLACERKARSGQVAGVVLVDVVPDPDPARARIYLRRLQADSVRLGHRQSPAWTWALVEDVLARHDDLRIAAAGAQVPIALVRGGQGLIRAEDIARLRAIVPSLEVRTVARAGHQVAREQPDVLADVLLELLSSPPLAAWRRA